jgi:hypothetical protein
VWIGQPDTGHDMRMTLASRRLRDAGRKLGELRSVGAEFVAAGVAARREHDHIPAPIGVEFPHRVGSTPCDPEHPRWAGYEDALEDARERAAIEVSDNADDETFHKRVVALLKTHPNWKLWDDTEAQCSAQFIRRQKAKALKRELDDDAIFRRDYKARGGDVGAIEYLERLSGATRAKKYAARGEHHAAREARRKTRVRAFRQ